MKNLLYTILAALGALMFIQCSDWTEMEPKFTEPVNINSEDYYKALREYKKSKHPIVFGWYSDWTGTGANMYNQLRGIPDSMDIISLWGGAFNLSEAQKSDLKEVREKKGTRVLYCQHIMDIGRSHTPESVEKDFIVDGVQYKSKGEAMAAYWDGTKVGRIEMATEILHRRELKRLSANMRVLSSIRLTNISMMVLI